MNSAEHVTDIIRHAKELKNIWSYRNITLSYHRTSKQVQEYKALKATLKSSTDGNEIRIKIQYVTGFPKTGKYLNYLICVTKEDDPYHPALVICGLLKDSKKIYIPC